MPAGYQKSAQAWTERARNGSITKALKGSAYHKRGMCCRCRGTKHMSSMPLASKLRPAPAWRSRSTNERRFTHHVSILLDLYLPRHFHTIPCGSSCDYISHAVEKATNKPQLQNIVDAFSLVVDNVKIGSAPEDRFRARLEPLCVKGTVDRRTLAWPHLMVPSEAMAPHRDRLAVANACTDRLVPFFGNPVGDLECDQHGPLGDGPRRDRGVWCLS